MIVHIQGQGSVTLTANNYVGGGGQGSVYAIGDTAYKVYTDPTTMIPPGKIRELAPLPIPLFSRPDHLLLDSKGTVVGYTTQFVDDAYVLCQLFPKAFRDRQGLTHDKVFKLVEVMRDGFGVAHKAEILLIDPNEMNFLVDSKFTKITFIDTDSYQTRSYPATVIMDSIRDRHMAHPKAFNEGTDWFSFACVSLQMLIGIHPYRGKHPTVKGFDERMKANLSVFNKDVKVPASTYPFDVIPKTWKSWYEAVLERGDRCAPPGGQVTVAIVRPIVKMVQGSGNLILEEIGQYGSDITNVWAFNHRLVVATGGGLWLDGRVVAPWADTTAVAFSPMSGAPVACRHGTEMEMFDCQSKSPMSFGLDIQRLTSFDGRLYAKVQDKILEVILTDMGQKVVASTRVAATVMPNASMLFPGGVVQSMLGSMFVSLFPVAGQAYQIRMPELDAYRVMDAKYDRGVKGGVLMVMGRTRKGTYDRLVFRFDASFTTYDMRKVEDTQNRDLNFVCTDAGVCIFREDDELELTSVAMGAATVKRVSDKFLQGDVQLFKRGGQVLVSLGDKLFTMRMK